MAMAGPSPEAPNMADQEPPENSMGMCSGASGTSTGHLADGSVNSLEGTSEILNNGKQQEPLTPEQQHHLFLEFHLRSGGGKGRAMMYQQQNRSANNEDNWHPDDDTSTFFSKVGDLFAS